MERRRRSWKLIERIGHITLVGLLLTFNAQARSPQATTASLGTRHAPAEATPARSADPIERAARHAVRVLEKHVGGEWAWHRKGCRLEHRQSNTDGQRLTLPLARLDPKAGGRPDEDGKLTPHVVLACRSTERCIARGRKAIRLTRSSRGQLDRYELTVPTMSAGNAVVGRLSRLKSMCIDAE